MNENLLRAGQDQKFRVGFRKDYTLKPAFTPLPPGNYEVVIREVSIVPKRNKPNERNLVLDLVVAAPSGQTGMKLRDYIPIPIGEYASPEEEDKACFRIQSMIASLYGDKLEAIKEKGGVNLNPQVLTSKKVWIESSNRRGDRGGIFNEVAYYITQRDYEDNPGPTEQQMESQSEMPPTVEDATMNATESLQDLLPPEV